MGIEFAVIEREADGGRRADDPELLPGLSGGGSSMRGRELLHVQEL